MKEFIETRRCILRGLKNPSFAMAKKLYAVVNSSRENLREWLAWVNKINSAEDEYNHYLVEICQARWNAGTGFAYAILSKNSEQILGCVEIFNASFVDKIGEIGYWLSTDAVGHGYIQEAVTALETEAFSAGLTHIVIRCDTRNLRSCNVAKRCGYVLERIISQDSWDKFHHRFRDTAMWRKMRGGPTVSR